METRRRPAMEAASWRSVAYHTGGNVVDMVFNLIRPVISVCLLSTAVVRIVGWESVLMFVWLDDPQQNVPPC